MSGGDRRALPAPWIAALALTLSIAAIVGEWASGWGEGDKRAASDGGGPAAASTMDRRNRPRLPEGAPDTVLIADLTTVELQAAVKAGFTTAIVATGGLEQNGAHLELGKHERIAAWESEEIARRLGDALAAPVVPYVPEGSIRPPSGNMTGAGTVSVDEATFESLIVGICDSLAAAGFKRIFIIGDHGLSQEGQAAAAGRVNAEWRTLGMDAIAWSVPEYYSGNGQDDLLRSMGETDATIGSHAGIEDTSETMAIHPEGVREAMRARGAASGADGEIGKASAELGRRLLGMKAETAAQRIERLRGWSAKG